MQSKTSQHKPVNSFWMIEFFAADNMIIFYSDFFAAAGKRFNILFVSRQFYFVSGFFIHKNVKSNILNRFSPV